MPESIVHLYSGTKAFIYFLEAIAAIIAPLALAQILPDHYIAFIDNEAVCTAFIKGSSTSRDVDHLASIAHLVSCRSGIRLWFEWIDSDSNISDGLSRLGVHDEFAIQQKWQLREHEDIGHKLFQQHLTEFIR